MSTRSYISLKTKLAAALLTMMRPDESGALVRIISHEEAKTLTADQIIARFHFDHYPIRKTDGGVDEPWNLEPRPIAEHDKKTREVDIPQIAKQKRIRGETRNVPRQKIPSRPNAWPRGRKIKSRGFQKPAQHIST